MRGFSGMMRGEKPVTKSKLSSAWSWLVNWFEHGDLVPLLVIVSSVHYAVVLAGRDYWPVAIAIGLLVDLGHYRTIRAAMRYTGDDRRQAFVRWIIAAAMTAISLSYHERYYRDLWLSAPLPLLIAALAWLQRVDRQQPMRGERSPTKTPVDVSLAPVDHPVEFRYLCECGYGTNDQHKFAGHKSAEIRARSNGKAHPVIIRE